VIRRPARVGVSQKPVRRARPARSCRWCRYRLHEPRWCCPPASLSPLRSRVGCRRARADWPDQTLKVPCVARASFDAKLAETPADKDLQRGTCLCVKVKASACLSGRLIWSAEPRRISSASHPCPKKPGPQGAAGVKRYTERRSEAGLCCQTRPVAVGRKRRTVPPPSACRGEGKRAGAAADFEACPPKLPSRKTSNSSAPASA